MRMIPSTRALRLLGGLCLLAATAASTSSCSGVRITAPLQPPMGIIFTDVKAPLDFDMNDDGTPTPVAGLRSGTSDANFLLIPLIGFLTFAWGDASVEEAARNGGVSKAEYGDYHVFNVLGIYTRTTVTIYGN